MSRKSLILATDDSSAGCLKAARIADHVVFVDHRLVTGPVPAAFEPAAFFAERAKRGCSEVRRWDEDGSKLAQAWLELTGTGRTFDRVEIWPDPDPNSQLVLLQVLGWLRCDPDIVQRLTLADIDFRIGSRTPEDIARLRPRSRALSDVQFETANRALRAFQQPTPEAWSSLLRDDLEALPHLRQTVCRLLEELPAVDTALTSSETKLLEIISCRTRAPMRVLGEYIASNPLSAFNYWELGRTLHRLAHCQVPAILGLDDGPFTLEMHDDSARFERYRSSALSLSELGRDLLERRADFSRHNRISRWWGGTRLTNDRLWRWDAISNVLVAPV